MEKYMPKCKQLKIGKLLLKKRQKQYSKVCHLIIIKILNLCKDIQYRYKSQDRCQKDTWTQVTNF